MEEVDEDAAAPRPRMLSWLHPCTLTRTQLARAAFRYVHARLMMMKPQGAPRRPSEALQQTGHFVAGANWESSPVYSQFWKKTQKQNPNCRIELGRAENETLF